MKKFSPFILLIVLMMFSIWGCSDEDDNGTGITEPPYTEDEFDYFISVVNIPDRGMFSINLINYQGEPIETVTLTLNGVDIPMNWVDSLYSWVGNVELVVNSNYNFDLTVNDSAWDFNLLVPPTPTVNWPMQIDFSEDWELSWNLNPDIDSQIQTMIAISFDYEYNIVDDEVALIESSDREFEFPGGWLTAGEMLYILTMAETNYFMDTTLLAVLVNQETALYETLRSGYKIVSPKFPELQESIIRAIN